MIKVKSDPKMDEYFRSAAVIWSPPGSNAGLDCQRRIECAKCERYFVAIPRLHMVEDGTFECYNCHGVVPKVEV